MDFGYGCFVIECLSLISLVLPIVSMQKVRSEDISVLVKAREINRDNTLSGFPVDNITLHKILCDLLPVGMRLS